MRMPQPRRGIVYSVDPTTLRAKVQIMPEQTITGWLPIAMPCVGGGWGVVAAPPPGSQVLIIPTDGNNNAAVVVSAHWSNAQPPPTGYTVGELWLFHETGAYLKVNNLGGVFSRDQNNATVVLDGTGKITATDKNGAVVELTGTGAIYAKDQAGAYWTLPNDGTAAIADATGHYVKLQNNGTISMLGNLIVSGDISDQNGAHGSLNNLRGNYNNHTHNGVTPGSGNTGPTDLPIS